MAYWVEGEGLEADGRALASHCSMTLDPEVPLQLRNPQGSDDSEVLLLQVCIIFSSRFLWLLASSGSMPTYFCNLKNNKFQADWVSHIQSN